MGLVQHALQDAETALDMNSSYTPVRAARRAFLEATLFGCMVVVLALPTSLLHRFIGFQGFIELLVPVSARFSLGYK